MKKINQNTNLRDSRRSKKPIKLSDFTKDFTKDELKRFADAARFAYGKPQ